MAKIKLEEAPTAARTFYDKGMAALERDNLNYAMDMFESALEIEPRLLQVRKLLRATALKLVHSAPPKKRSGLTTSVKNLRAQRQLKQIIKKDPLAGITTAEKWLREEPANLKFIDGLCQAAVAAKLPEIAIQTLEIARDQAPQELVLLESLAALYQQESRFSEEYTCRQRIARLKPSDARVQKALKDSAARASINEAGWDKAHSFHDVAPPATPPTSTDPSETHRRQLRKNIETDPQNPIHRRALAEQLMQQKNYSAAIEILQPLSGVDLQIDQQLSQIQRLQLEQELKDAPTPSARAQIKEQLNTFRLATAAQQVEHYPNDLHHKFEYGTLLYAAGKYTAAIQQLQAAQRNPKHRIQSLHYLGLCFKEKGQFDIALQQLETALAELSIMDENKKKILYELAALYEITGNPSRATALLKEIYSVDIGFRDVATKIDQAYSAGGKQ